VSKSKGNKNGRAGAEPKPKNTGERKGGPTPKRDAGNRASQQKNREANRQWLIVAGVIAVAIVVFVVLGTMFFPDAAEFTGY